MAVQFKSGPVTPAEARGNRELFERRWADPTVSVLTLPPARLGALGFDQAPSPPPRDTPITVQGDGTVARTLIEQSHYPLNCTLSLIGLGHGWADPLARVAGSSGAVIVPVTAAPNYRRGRVVVYSFRVNGFYLPGGMLCRRHAVSVADPERGLVILDSDPEEGANALKWMEGFPLADVAAGATGAECLTDPVGLATGTRALVTPGPAFANEAGGERVVVLAVEGRRVVFDRPLRRAWASPALATGKVHAGVTLRGLTLAGPLGNTLADPLFAKFFDGLTLEDVQIGLPAELTKPISVNSGGDFRMLNCSGSGVVLNTVRGFSAAGGRLGHFGTEELTFDGELSSLEIVGAPAGRAGHPHVNGFQSLLGGSDLTLRSVRIRGFGLGGGSAVIGDPRDCRLIDLDVTEPTAWSALWLGGDGHSYRGLRSAHPPLCAGRGMSLDDCRVPFVEFRDGSSGDCRGVVVDADRTQYYRWEDWTWQGGTRKNVIAWPPRSGMPAKARPAEALGPGAAPVYRGAPVSLGFMVARRAAQAAAG